MEIKGLNADGEIFDENSISINSLIHNLKSCEYLKNFDLEKHYAIIEKLYNEIFSSNPGKTTSPIIAPETLFHLSPMADSQTGEIFYDKLISIAKNGLLPVDMLIFSSDATDPTYVSFHSVLENEKTLEDIDKRIKQGNNNLSFFINTNTPAIQKLIRIGRTANDSLNSLPTFDNLLCSNNDEDVLKKMFAFGNLFCPDNLDQKGVFYLPIGVPSSYISAIVVPDRLLEDEKLIQILSKNFDNALILDKSQNIVVQKNEDKKKENEKGKDL